ncbi:MAG: IS1595 family transposase [Puniceicoccaceae bacterium]|nr:MAG: IS1595 family transposase [Puniceicoccaceae bacterium]
MVRDADRTRRRRRPKMTRRSPVKWLLKKRENPFGTIPWKEMYLMLPEEGVRATFPNTESCEARLASVRWPQGVQCLSCEMQDVSYIENRALYQCRACRRQFSVTAGTEAHRSRLDLRMWFIAAEEIITAYAEETGHHRLVGQSMAHRYGISYSATHRLKTTLTNSLSQPGGGLIGECVCFCALPVLRKPDLSPEEWDRMLSAAMYENRGARRTPHRRPILIPLEEPDQSLSQTDDLAKVGHALDH